jgi:hypothetical protein
MSNDASKPTANASINGLKASFLDYQLPEKSFEPYAESKQRKFSLDFSHQQSKRRVHAPNGESFTVTC